MNRLEYVRTDNITPFAWRSKFKWFTDNVNFLQRVADGRFNNSKFDWGRYEYIIIYEVESIDSFKRITDNELMLARKDAHKVKVKSMKKMLYSEFKK